jgi:NodT family efflux transporter outer membrane factor (OMF) lipoprotein
VDAAQARLLLATAIATAYADLARLLDLRDIRQSALDVRLTTAKLVTARETNGLETRGSRRQAEALVSGAGADLGDVEELIALKRHQLAALVGAGPDRGLAISRPTLRAAASGGLPQNVTTELVGRRPDVAAARLRTEAAASRIKVARAAFYPAVRLEALIGLQSLGIGNLFEADSTFGKAGPAVSLPLFRSGALSAGYRGAGAAFDESVADYNRAVVGAYQQVADAVAARQHAAESLRYTRLALAAMEDAYAIALSRYNGGLSNYLDVLTVEDRLLKARLDMSEVNAAVRSVDVVLIRALGGGYAPPPADKTSEDIPHE